MDYKWIGAVLIVSACGGFGFSLGSAHRREERILRGLIRALDYMASELHFRATPLPELLRSAAGESGKELGPVFSGLADRLDANISPDVGSCMKDSLGDAQYLPESTAKNLLLLGSSLGRFDLSGQLKGLEEARSLCRKDLDALTTGREDRLRNYQTLSLCAGAALAILLI